MLYFAKRSPLWLAVFLFLFSVGAFYMLVSGGLDNTIFYLYIRALVIPTILVKFLAFCFGVLMLVISIDGAFFVHKGKLFVSKEGMRFESGRPDWWPLHKSVSFSWTDVKSAQYFKVRGNEGLNLISSKGNITVAKSHYGDFEKIIVEITNYLKK